MSRVYESLFHDNLFNTVSLLLMNTEYVRFCEFRLNANKYPRTCSLARLHFRCSQMQPSDDVLLPVCTFFLLTPSGFVGYHAKCKIISTPSSDTPASSIFASHFRDATWIGPSCRTTVAPASGSHRKSTGRMRMEGVDPERACWRASSVDQARRCQADICADHGSANPGAPTPRAGMSSGDVGSTLERRGGVVNGCQSTAASVPRASGEWSGYANLRFWAGV